VPYYAALKEWQGAIYAEVRRELGLHSDATDDRSPSRVIAGLRARLYRAPLKVVKVVKRVGDKIIDSTKKTGELIGIPPLPTKMATVVLDDFRRVNVELIESLPTRLFDDLEQLLNDRANTPVAELAKEIQERFEVSDSRAALIARDQVLKLNGQATELQHQEAGIERYTWSTSRDERVRDGHEHLEGKEFDYAHPPVVDERSGRRANPGQDFQCRCVALPILPDYE
jgi:SPP1 gp7 family putative phage head morphogenesis protein